MFSPVSEMKNQPLPSEQSGVPIWTWVGLHALPPQLLGMNEVALDKEWWFGLKDNSLHTSVLHMISKWRFGFIFDLLRHQVTIAPGNQKPYSIDMIHILVVPFCVKCMKQRQDYPMF